MLTAENYYSNSDNYGDYQYSKLKDVVNNFMINFTGDETVIGNAKRFNVLYHMKRGIQELNYDALKEVNRVEIELNEKNELILPHDYISYVRISWIDDKGMYHPMSVNSKTALAKAYLQDDKYNILFDSDGNPLEGDSMQQDRLENISSLIGSELSSIDSVEDTIFTRFTNTTTKNANGTFNIDKKRGVIQFSSDIGDNLIVIEYISDGLNSSSDDDIVVNKLAVEALNSYVKWMLLSNKLNVQEYIVRRFKKEYYNARRQAKLRLSGIRINELVLLLNGKSDWIKN
tara:strand:+ start:397 stop:1257 length:861 start_codon:yes stop_codon:yes gene_type:complete